MLKTGSYKNHIIQKKGGCHTNGQPPFCIQAAARAAALYSSSVSKVMDPAELM